MARSSVSVLTPSEATHSPFSFSLVSSVLVGSTSLKAPPLSPMAFWNSPSRRRRGHQRAHGEGAGAFAKDGDVVRIAAELGDVGLDPLERGDHIEQTVVPC